MSDEVFFNKMVTKGLEPIESDGRFFEGYLTVQVKDKQGEVTIVDELYKVLPIWMDRGAPITDTHSNRVIGKGINFARAEYTDSDGTIYPAIKVTGKIFKDYELDNEIWAKIKSGEYKGLSFGGSTKTDREPMRMKDGSIAYALSKLEHYEVAVCKDPAVPLAVITEINPIAKANMNCDNTGCYVTKPILGKPNFESAVRNVMEESDVPEKNAKRIVGAAEQSKEKAEDITKYKIMGHEGQKCPFGNCGHVTGNLKDFQTHTNTKHPLGHGKGDYSFLHYPKNHPDTKRMRQTTSNPEYKRDMAGQKRSQEEKKAVICKDCGLPKKINKKYRPNTECPTCKQIRPDHRYRCPHCGAIGYDVDKANKKKGKQVKERKKRKKQGQGIGNQRSWRAFKSLVDTNKILDLYQGNILPLARILDKGKKKLTKVGSAAMVDPNQANQGAGFAIRNQTPPRRKKTRTMEAKLGDGTYDYSS